METIKGRFFSSANADEVLLQRDFAKKLEKDPESVLGKTLTVRYAERQSGATAPASASSARKNSSALSGFLDEQPFGGMRMISRARVFLPIQTAEAMNLMQPADTQQLVRSAPGARTYSMLTVRMKSAAYAEKVEESVKKMNYSAYSYLDATKSIRRFFAVLDMFLGIFGSLALAVASLAIVNTLVMAVLERRREIGIMKALGASDADVKKLFFAEAATMGLIGGALGVALGWVIGRAINFGTNLYLHKNEDAGGKSLDGSAVAGRRSHCFRGAGQRPGRYLSGCARRQTRSGAGVALRMTHTSIYINESACGGNEIRHAAGLPCLDVFLLFALCFAAHGPGRRSIQGGVLHAAEQDSRSRRCLIA